MGYIYIAAPFFNPEQLATVQFVEDCLSAAGVEFYSPRSDGVLKDVTSEIREVESKRLFELNVERITNSIGMLAIVDDKDSGTTFEIGFARALWISIVTFSQHRKEANLMLAHATIWHLRGGEEMLEFSMRASTMPKTSGWWNALCEDYKFSKLMANT